MLQKAHQTVFAVKIIQITAVAFNPAVAADRIPDGAWLVAPSVTKLLPKAIFVRFLHAPRPCIRRWRACKPD